MSNTIGLRTSVIAANADVAVYTVGQPLYGAPTSEFSNDSTVLVAPGQVVFARANADGTLISMGTTATRANTPNLLIGVGVSYSGDPVIADDIIFFNDGFHADGMRDMRGRTAECGTTNIVDALWNGGCLECGKTYTLRVTVYDPFTEAVQKAGLGAQYQFSYTLPCGDCSTGDCVETTPNSDELMCGLYNKIKGINHDPNWDIKYNGLPIPADHEYRFDVAMLYDDGETGAPTTFEYCLAATDGDCTNCTNYTDIGGYNLTGGAETDVVFSPATFSEDSGEVLFSTKKQIQSAVAQLNAVLLTQGGSAVFLPAVGNCCDNNKIEVNTCLTDFVLNDGAGDPITPCNETDEETPGTNPFDDQTIYSQCQDCDSSNTTRSFTNGLRFYAKPIEHVCQCVKGNIILQEYFAEVEVAFGDEWPKTGVRSLVRQVGSLPKNQGFQWVDREIGNAHDGFRQAFNVDLRVGKYGLPGETDILNRLTTECHESYCSLEGTYEGKTDHDLFGGTAYAVQDIALLLPKGNTTAQTSVLTAWNAYFAGGDYMPATITCASW